MLDSTVATGERRAPARRGRPPLADRGFRNLFGAAAVSAVGTQVSFLAVPLLAVTVLDATPAQVGLLGALKTVAFLLIGLPAGAWLDRVRRRGVMVGADLARAALLGSVPVAWWLGALTIGQLYAVVLLCGVATVFFDVASHSLLPSLVGRERLTGANAMLESNESLAGIVGPSIAGYLVQLTSAGLAILIDAGTYLWSAALLTGIRGREPAPGRGERRPLSHEIRAGVEFVVRHPLLRPVALAGAGTNLFLQIAIVTMPLMYKRVLDLSDGQLGLFFAFGGIGGLLGSLSARWVARRLGSGPALWLTGLAAVPFGFVVPLVDGGAWRWVAMCCWLVLTYRIGVNNVILVSLRQRTTPDALLNRMNATMRFLMTGALAIGAALAGLIGQYAGIRAALWVGAAGLSVVWLPLFFSPLRRLRELPG